MIRLRSYRLQVDPVACDGYGYCAELLPEFLCVDEWGYPMVPAGAVPDRLMDLARRAVADCPRRALEMVAVDTDVAPRATKVVLASSRR